MMQQYGTSCGLKASVAQRRSKLFAGITGQESSKKGFGYELGRFYLWAVATWHEEQREKATMCVSEYLTSVKRRLES